ncbi:Cobalt ion binding [Hibiscus syriacus]|uniref:Cobalt ion binding n=1 Tax=Hibiscus syriacus TaxID=106335 RepID=A0A6A3AER2_HIBSY|nr:Cobalt ion binding [Hibiscus syriacus]
MMKTSRKEQRRRKIGLANKGRVPWNKGRKHSAETQLRIKQRTIEALNDPKMMSYKTEAVRKNMSEHPRTHSEESKARIGSSVRHAWGKPLKWKQLGERFFLSWMKSITEAARKGGSDQAELEWDSYDKIKQEIAHEQLQWDTEKAKGKEIAKIRKKKSISSQVSIQGDSAQIPALEKLNIELIKKEKMQREVSLAEQIKAAKSRRAEPISAKILAVSSSFLSYNARLKE